MFGQVYPAMKRMKNCGNMGGGLGAMAFIASSDDESCDYADLVALANFLIFTTESLWNLRYDVGL